jgi:hypothetical protein
MKLPENTQIIISVPRMLTEEQFAAVKARWESGEAFPLEPGWRITLVGPQGVIFDICNAVAA